MTDSPCSWPKLPRAAAVGGLTCKVLWLLAVAAFAPFAHSQVPEKAPAPTRDNVADIERGGQSGR
jgi:hypothetical protein